MKSVFKNAEEDIAARYLRLMGFTVLARNDRRFGAELDFLCAENSKHEIFIFEVKKASPAHEVYPKISAAQLKRLRTAALKMQTAGGRFLTVRISLLIVDAPRGLVEMIGDI